MPAGVYPRQSGNTIAERLDYFSIPEPNSGCLLWLGTVGRGRRSGYGHLWVEGENRGAHVVAWEHHHGRPVPPDLCVLHKCDVRSCIEPLHLFLGTHGDNAFDRAAKGRGPRGERHFRAKLTVDAVRAIRADGRTHRAIAGDLGVTASLVGMVKAGKIWRHVA